MPLETNYLAPDASFVVFACVALLLLIAFITALVLFLSRRPR